VSETNDINRRNKGRKRWGINFSRKEKFKINGETKKPVIKENLNLNKNYLLIIRTNLWKHLNL